MHAFLIVGRDKEARAKIAQQKTEKAGTKEVLLLTTEEKHTIEEIRRLKSSLAYAPRESEAGRVVIIEEAQRLTVEAANAFLKTLEEPLGNTLFVLTAPNQEQVIQTIVSRCQLVDLGHATPLSGDIESVNRLVHSKPAQRLEFLESIKDRREALQFCLNQTLTVRKLLRQKPTSRLVSLLERLEETRRDLEANVNVKIALADLLLNYPSLLLKI